MMQECLEYNCRFGNHSLHFCSTCVSKTPLTLSAVCIYIPHLHLEEIAETSWNPPTSLPFRLTVFEGVYTWKSSYTWQQWATQQQKHSNREKFNILCLFQCGNIHMLVTIQMVTTVYYACSKSPYQVHESSHHLILYFTYTYSMPILQSTSLSDPIVRAGVANGSWLLLGHVFQYVAIRLTSAIQHLFCWLQTHSHSDPLTLVSVRTGPEHSFFLPEAPLTSQSLHVS